MSILDKVFELLVTFTARAWRNFRAVGFEWLGLGQGARELGVFQ